MADDFEIIGKIEDVTIIAVGSRIREIKRLRKAFGEGRWRKLKGILRRCAWPMVQFVAPNYIGTRPTE